MRRNPADDLPVVGSTSSSELGGTIRTRSGVMSSMGLIQVITDPRTPVKWINYIGTRAFGGFVDHTGGALICKDDPTFNRITKYIQQMPASDFKGETFSRLDGYKQVIANAKAPKTDKAYALFRAINCYAPAGYNSCGGEDVAPAVRKGWFRQLKSGYADTQWGKSLQYYW